MYEVRLSKEFNKEFAKLEERAAKGDGEAKYLLRIISKGLAKLAKSPKAGKHVPRKLVAKDYVARYGVTNLWKLNLDACWRMIYTLEGDRVMLHCIVLEVLDHKKYNRKFGYKK